MVVPAFFVKQRITLMVNRYEVIAANPDGSEGPMLAFAEQKRMKLKEEVVFYADASKSRPVFRFKARQRLDVAAQHDVYDEYGTPIGSFGKQFGASLLRSTWKLSAPGIDAVGRERRLSSPCCAAAGSSSPTSARCGSPSSSTSTSSTPPPGRR
jgi:hypothetical protein